MDMTGLSGEAIAAVSASAGLLGLGAVFGIRKLIRMGQYTYLNARLSTVGNPYVKRDEVLPIMEARSLSEAVNMIRGDLALKEEVSSFKEADAELMRSFHSSITRLWREVPVSVAPLVGAYVRKLEGEEVKRLTRLVGERSDPLFPVGYLDDDLERSIVGSTSTAASLEHLEALPFHPDLNDAVKEGEVDLIMMDGAIDRSVLDIFREVSGRSSSAGKGTSAFADMMVDRYNLTALLRGKANGMQREDLIKMIYRPTGTIGISDLEAIADSTSLREAVSTLGGTNVEKHLKEGLDRGIMGLETGLERMMLDGAVALSGLYFSSVGPTIRFLVSREIEVKNLRCALQAVSSGWEKDRAKGMMIFEEVD